MSEILKLSDRAVMQKLEATTVYRDDMRRGTTLVREYASCQMRDFAGKPKRAAHAGTHGRHHWELAKQGVGFRTFVCLGSDDLWEHEDKLHKINYMITDEQLVGVKEPSFLFTAIKMELDNYEKSKWKKEKMLYLVGATQNQMMSWQAEAGIHNIYQVGPSSHRLQGRSIYEDDVLIVCGEWADLPLETGSYADANGKLTRILYEASNKGFAIYPNGWERDPAGYPPGTLLCVTHESLQAATLGQTPQPIARPSPGKLYDPAKPRQGRWVAGKKPIGRLGPRER